MIRLLIKWRRSTNGPWISLRPGVSIESITVLHEIWCPQTDSDSWSSIKPSIGMDKLSSSMDGKCLGIGCSFAHARKVRFFFPPDNVLLYLLVGASFCYMGGCTLNDAMDKDFDDQHNPNRPIPSAKDFSFASLVTWSNPTWLRGVLLIIGAECSLCGLLFFCYRYCRMTGFTKSGQVEFLLWVVAVYSFG